PALFNQEIGDLLQAQTSNTPKAFANFSPVVGAQRQPWDQIIKKRLTLKGLGMCGDNPYRVQTIVLLGFPRLSLALQPWGLKLANAFGVFTPNFKLTQY